MHSASWDEDYDYKVILSYKRMAYRNGLLMLTKGKRVAVIGNGSSGIQIVPGMLPDVTHIDHYIRGRTWLSPTFARDKVDQRGANLENCKHGGQSILSSFTENPLVSFTAEEIETFKKNPEVYQKFRKGKLTHRHP